MPGSIANSEIIYLLLDLSFLGHLVGVLCLLRCMSASASLALFHIVVEAGLGVRLLSIYLTLFTFGKWFPMLMRFQSQLASSHIMVCWDSDVGLLGFTLVGTLCACIALCLSSFSLYLSITAQCSRKFHLLKHIPRSTVVCNMALITDLFLFLAAL